MNTMVHIADFYEFTNSLLEHGVSYVSLEEVIELFRIKGNK